jgi:hypothetical protein
MRSLTVGVAVLVCVALGNVRASAQDIPEEARKAIAQNLHGPFLVYLDKVQEELKLSNEQKEKLHEHLKEGLPDHMKFFEGLGEKKAEEREKELQAYRKKAHEKLVAVLKDALKDGQHKRLRQLVLQQEGPFALLHDEGVGKDLKVTDEQRKQFMAVVQEMQKKIEPLIKEAQSGGKPEEIRPKVMKLRKEYGGRFEAILSNEQKKQWQEMLGKALDLDD